jgi:hypothetical protein
MKAQNFIGTILLLFGFILIVTEGLELIGLALTAGTALIGNLENLKTKKS